MAIVTAATHGARKTMMFMMMSFVMYHTPLVGRRLRTGGQAAAPRNGGSRTRRVAVPGSRPTVKHNPAMLRRVE